MKKTSLKRVTILNGEVETNEYLKADFDFLTKNDPEAETLFSFMLDEADGCVGSAVMKYRRFLREFGKRTVTLEQLQNTKDESELHNLLQELFLWRIQPYFCKRLVDEFTLTQLYTFSKKYPIQNPLSILGFSKGYAVEHFELEDEAC